MTLVQLEYIIAVDTHRHFAAAAEACFVTQPTLSMQIQKLEEELVVKIFDRSKQPVLPTEAGVDIIEQARRVVAEKNLLLELIDSKKGIVNGELKIGVIPTLAPYLLPLFIHSFTKKYPHVKLQVNELTTDILIERLKDGRIDAGILVTPLNDPGIKEEPLFYEELMAYVSKSNEAFKKNYVLPKDIDPNKLWLLEEGHCFRSQIMNLCELRKTGSDGNNFQYEAGSLETLRRMVDLYDGITILPELATIDMTVKQQNQLRHFKPPVPVREISLVMHRTFIKRRLVEALKQEVLAVVPERLRKNKKSVVLPV
ncbi:MAG: hydrogen peroxide-inducible genes activator [Bacteroidota bacterium]|nr:hydrogen peroxide-inducible genes activator [Bacteroidota bacterium]